MSEESLLGLTIKFVRDYYKILMNKPTQLSSQFYSDYSICSRGFTSDQNTLKSAQGLEEIQKLIDEFHPKSKINIVTIDHQSTLNDAVLISTIGEISYSKVTQKFTQNFILVPNKGNNSQSYYIQNDILRFFDSYSIQSTEQERQTNDIKKDKSENNQTKTDETNSINHEDPETLNSQSDNDTENDQEHVEQNEPIPDNLPKEKSTNGSQKSNRNYNRSNSRGRSNRYRRGGNRYRSKNF